MKLTKSLPRRRVSRQALLATTFTAALVAGSLITLPALADQPAGTPAGVAPLQSGPIGWAAVNGTTTGGAGGPTVTVTSGSQLIDEMQADGPRIIQVSGTISIS